MSTRYVSQKRPFSDTIDDSNTKRLCTKIHEPIQLTLKIPKRKIDDAVLFCDKEPTYFDNIPSDYINIDVLIEKYRRKNRNLDRNDITEKQLKKIIKQCLEVHKNHICDSYDTIVSRVLQDRFDQFNNFNQDCICRQLKDSFCFTSYIS